jgi:hypothetical protein
MSLLGFDGFSVYRTLAEIEEQAWTIDTNPGANLALDVNAGQNERGGLSIGSVNNDQVEVWYDLGGLKTELVFGFWFTFDGFDTSGGDTEDMFITLQSTTSTRCSFRIGQDGSISFRRSTNSTEYFDSSDASETVSGQQHYLFQGTEYKIEMRLSMINSTGSMELWVNDEQWARIIDSADLDGTANRFYFKSGIIGGGAQYTISDFYFIENDATDPSERLGSSWQVEVLRPTADSGTENDWTASTGTDEYAMVDEAPRHDADATYNSSSVATNIDRYTTTGTLNGARVLACKVNAVARHEGSAENFRLTHFENATAGNGSTEAVTESYLPYWYMTTVNPDTSAEWTVAEVEGSEFGVEDVA